MKTEVQIPHISTHRSHSYEFSLASLPVTRHGIILKPNGNPWESKATFNAGAVLANGKVTLLYRAFGEDNDPKYEKIPERPSSIGFAASRDGITIDERLNEPVLRNAEDPRITSLDGKYFMSYTKTQNFQETDSWNPNPAIAVSTDLKNFQELGIIEIKGLSNVTKNVVLFPGKIRGRYAALARKKPDIYVIYSNDLIHWDSPEFAMGPRKGYWDSEFIGPGDPPRKTPIGWLEIYHGVDEANTYRLGAVLLDLNNPSLPLARSIHPLLEPIEDYEQKGIHPNVVYTCGTMVGIDEILRLYYGAADQRLALATTPIKPLIERMKK